MTSAVIDLLLLNFITRTEQVVERRPYNDQPIADPSEDKFGINPFARALAKSIQNLTAPEGVVIAINGPWGSGKSSAVNLVLHHLKTEIEAEKITVIKFACWWFRGEEALALAFFRELYAGIGPSIGARSKRSLRRLSSRLLRAGSVVGGSVDLAGGGGIGAVIASAMDWLSSLCGTSETPEKLHAEISTALAKHKRKFLVVIDDIDRLSPDEALLIFRLLKSVGRLPNVIYLIVYDRALAEKIVAERYPTEGPDYLEKIVQASFEIPKPEHSVLCLQLLYQLTEICGSPPESDSVRFMNIFYDAIAPEIRTPRDIVRLANMISVTWPALGADVDFGDFIALEMLRLLRPNIYNAIRENKEKVCTGARPSAHQQMDQLQTTYDKIFLDNVNSEPDLTRLRNSLMRLFPPLEAVWNNMHYGDGSAAEWAQQRRACSKTHFDTYFRFSLSDDVLPKSEINVIIQNAGDSQFIENAFRDALGVIRRNGRTKAALLLDEFHVNASRVADAAVPSFISTIFKIADELNVPSDEAEAFSIGNNDLRIHWLIRKLTFERFSIEERSKIFMSACTGAALGWLVSFTESAYRNYHPREGRSPEPEENCLTTESDAEALRRKVLERIRIAAKSDELISNRRLPFLLFQWRDLANDDGKEVKDWTNHKLEQDATVVKLSEAFTSHSWTQGMGFAGLGDVVAKRHIRASVSGLESIMDKARFRARVEELSKRDDLPEDQMQIVRQFLTAWEQHDENPNAF